jgi:RNA polymerase sigma factor (TIGR02999 family)
MEPGEITVLLDRWSGGDRDAFAALVPLVYDELKVLAKRHLRRERDGHTLQPTALVHEAFLRLRGGHGLRMQSRAYFFGAAAQVMRRVLVDHARRRGAGKRSADLVPGELTKALARHGDERMDLRVFGGLSVEETAEYLGIAPATVKRHVAFARAWLYRELGGAGSGS